MKFQFFCVYLSSTSVHILLPWTSLTASCDATAKIWKLCSLGFKGGASLVWSFVGCVGGKFLCMVLKWSGGCFFVFVSGLCLFSKVWRSHMSWIQSRIFVEWDERSWLSFGFARRSFLVVLGKALVTNEVSYHGIIQWWFYCCVCGGLYVYI